MRQLFSVHFSCFARLTLQAYFSAWCAKGEKSMSLTRLAEAASVLSDTLLRACGLAVQQQHDKHMHATG